MQRLHVPEPPEQPLFQSYKAYPGLIPDAPSAINLPNSPLFPVQAPVGASRVGAPIGRLESEAYCGANNLCSLSSDQRLLACWGHAGLYIYAEGEVASWHEVSAEPVLSAAAVHCRGEGDISRVVFSLASGVIGTASIQRDSRQAASERQQAIHVSTGALPNIADTRIWISSGSQAAPDDVINVLAYHVPTVDGRRVVELLAVQLTLPSPANSLEASSHLGVTVHTSWRGSALPKASFWHSASEVIVAAMGRYQSPAIDNTNVATTSEQCATSMEVDVEGLIVATNSDAQNSELAKQSHQFQPLPDEDDDTCVLSVLSMKAGSTSAWSLPRGRVLAAEASFSSGGLALLLEHERDALALHVTLTSEGVPALAAAPRCIPGLASVASARQNLRLCVCSPAWKFVALCQLTGSQAACVFRTPSEGVAMAPTCSAGLPEDEDLIGASLSETVLYVLTPCRVVRFALDAEVTIPDLGLPSLSKELPGGLNAAALLRMLDKMED